MREFSSVSHGGLSRASKADPRELEGKSLAVALALYIVLGPGVAIALTLRSPAPAFPNPIRVPNREVDVNGDD
jgi:hypothetical protein